jgi:hypothetical protein
MALTKRFFVALAAEYRALRPVTGTDEYTFALWEQMVRTTATALAAQNGMFNYARFYEACGVPARTPQGQA